MKVTEIVKKIVEDHMLNPIEVKSLEDRYVNIFNILISNWTKIGKLDMAYSIALLL